MGKGLESRVSFSNANTRGQIVPVLLILEIYARPKQFIVILVGITVEAANIKSNKTEPLKYRVFVICLALEPFDPEGTSTTNFECFIIKPS